jgi:myo-inositol-1(or 4)-monophosphatase
MASHFQDELLSMASEAALTASDVLCEMQASLESLHVSTKENNREVVSSADLAAESEVLRVLRRGPKASFITEETSPTDLNTDELCWIIDPLDGSSAYLHGLDTFSVSIAAWQRRRPLVGVIALPTERTVWRAAAGQGALGPSGPLQVSTRHRKEAIVSVSASVVRSLADGRARWDGLRDALEHAQGIRVAGSCAYDLVLMAQGKIDAFLGARQQLWDYAAGLLLVREAGGKVWTADTGSGRSDVLTLGANVDLLAGAASKMYEWTDVPDRSDLV